MIEQLKEREQAARDHAQVLVNRAHRTGRLAVGWLTTTGVLFGIRVTEAMPDQVQDFGLTLGVACATATVIFGGATAVSYAEAAMATSEANSVLIAMGQQQASSAEQPPAPEV